MTASPIRLPVRPRPQLVPTPNEFAILGADVKQAAGDVRALAERINRALSGPYVTLGSIDIAYFQADELADAAHALAKALRRARR